MLNFNLFGQELEVLGVEVQTLLTHSCGCQHRPKQRNVDRRKFARRDFVCLSHFISAFSGISRALVSREHVTGAAVHG
jgi:hypothetical protein